MFWQEDTEVMLGPPEHLLAESHDHFFDPLQCKMLPFRFLHYRITFFPL